MTKSTLFLAGILMLASGKADRFVRQLAPVVALTHVRVIDGTGGPGKDDQTVIIEGGRITALGDAAAVKIPSGASTLDLHGRTVIPGLVGMHNPLFYQLEPSGSASVIEAPRTFAKLYLASGVTTIRTGALDPDVDARITHDIDAGDEAGPKIRPVVATQPGAIGWREISALGIDNSNIRQQIDTLIRDGVAVTSTLAVIESYAIEESVIDQRVTDLLSSRLRDTFEQARDRRKDREKAKRSWWSGVLDQEMTFERAFVAAGGTLLAGADPRGWGAIVAGYADQRGLELLVSAGFTPEQSIAIATSNGARFLKDATIGEIATGRQADLVVVQGNPSQRISDVRKVELVFRNGMAYEPEKLIAAAAGTLGEFTLTSKSIWPVTIVLTLLAAIRAMRMLRRRRPAAAPLGVVATPLRSSGPE
jgi:hypothetical protein